MFFESSFPGGHTGKFVHYSLCDQIHIQFIQVTKIFFCLMYVGGKKGNCASTLIAYYCLLLILLLYISGVKPL